MTTMRRGAPTLLLFLAAASLIYLLCYQQSDFTPGNLAAHPEGWWGFWDQSWYIRSARALHELDLRASEHWYPFGYALIGAPFASRTNAQVYLVPDLLCLLASLASFAVVCRRLGVGELAAGTMFLVGMAASPYLRDVWAEPWNTSLSCALSWSLLALYAVFETSPAAGRAARAAAFGGGLLCPLMLVTRVTDGLIIAAVVLGMMRRLGFRRGEAAPALAASLGAASLGVAVTGVPLAVLWLRIYGFSKPTYLHTAGALGFDFSTLPWRAYLLLITPNGWFADSAGLFARLPWLLPGVAGALCLPFIAPAGERRVLSVLAGAILAYMAVFCSYADLVPSGLWTFHNVHYFKWCMPGLLLLGYKLIEHGVAHPRAAAAACAAVIALSCVRVAAKPGEDGAPAWMITVRGPVATRSAAVFNEMTFTDARGTMHAVKDVRTLPMDDGWRFIAMHRPFVGKVRIGGLPGGAWPDGDWAPVQAQETRFVRRWRLGFPCFL